MALLGWETARRESHRLECRQRLTTISAGLRQYASEYGELPPPVVRDASGTPLLSWRVLVLPFVGEESLHRRFRMHERWDSPHNRQLLDSRPAVFACDELPWADRRSTLIVAAVGEQTLFPPEGGVQSSELRGRGEETVWLLELHRDEAVVWTSPGDVDLATATPAGLNSNHGGQLAVTVSGTAADLTSRQEGVVGEPDWRRPFWRPSALNR